MSDQNETPTNVSDPTPAVVNVPEGTPKVRSAFDNRIAVTYDFDPEDDRTEQSFVDEVNINTIVKRYRDQGIVPQYRNAQFTDEPEVDFQEMQNALANIKSSYYELDPDTRKRFNGPEDYVQAISNPNRVHELVQAGIVQADKVELEAPAPTPPAEPPSDNDDDDDD